MEDAAGILQRDALIGLNAYWRVKKFSYSGSGAIEYMGCNEKHDVATTDTTWAIWKFLYSGDDLIGIEGPITDAWDSRTTLDWN